ncbi:MAG: gamma-glutamyl-gamma-aminobutyrate hydrolase family protein [Actinomycetota bacterium]|nr:gamma-glutamyl-gamma-aminobutyrate hydrolase family protein [Actinomycetota bacterium]
MSTPQPTGGPDRRPLIAMTCHFAEASWGGWTADAVITHAWYAHAVRQAGGRVVFVPPDPDGDDIADRVDAVVITGGADLDPAHYGEDPHPAVSTPDPERDVAEFALLRHAWGLDMPVLGVCRGLQVMAVGLGGSLVQHLPEATELVHVERVGYFVHHRATIHGESLAARVLGSGTITVNSSHHQAIADPGPLVVTGYAEDGTIEVCEDPTRTFCLGVQWHPEQPEQASGPLLFGALVEAAAAYRRSRG